MTTPPYVAQDLLPPYCAIRIWRDDDAFFDATLHQVVGGMAIITKAENRPGGATFTLHNNVHDDTDNIILESFEGWTDGTGAVKPGQFVELFDISATDDPRLIMDGRITTMAPQGDRVAFEIGDGISFLSKAGTWLRRNYRDPQGTDAKFLTMDTSREPPYTDISQFPGTPSYPVTLYRSFLRTMTYSGGTARLTRVDQGKTYTRIRAVRLRVRWTGPASGSATPTMRIKAVVGGLSAYSDTFVAYAISSGTVNIEINRDFEEITEDISYLVSISAEKVSSGGLSLKLSLSVESITAIVDTEEPVTPSSLIYEFTDASDLDKQYPSNRLGVVYENGKQLTTDIMSQIANAIGYGSEISDDAPQVLLPVYRVGGSYAQTYMQKLADIADRAENARLSYMVRDNPPKVYIGRRKDVWDDYQTIYAFAGNQAHFAGEKVFASFSPRKTLKNRPNLVTLKGTISGEKNTTVTVTFEDADSTDLRGCIIEAIQADSHANSLQTIGQAAYNALAGTDLDRWEGEIVLPGIVWGMMGEDGCGSGEVIFVEDSRYGISEKVKAMEVEYNYNTCLTKLTISNYGQIYSGSISNTNALAVEVTDMVGGISDTTLYNQQYCYFKTEESWSPGTAPKIAISDGGELTLQTDPAGVFILPNETTAVLAMFEAGDTHLDPAKEEDAFGIRKIILSGSGSPVELTIPEERRPDFYIGQTLVVCVMVRSG